MEQSSHYAPLLESCIRSYTNVIILIWGLLIVTSVALLFISRGEGKKGKSQTRKSVFSLFLIGVVVSLIVYSIYIFPVQEEIQENEYITYTGEFYVEECYGSQTRTYITIKYGDQNKITRYTVLCDLKGVEDNKFYHGVIVHTKYSKYLLNIVLYDE
ncbi:MAG: hypothetical protein ACI4WV_07915 [Eubacteriales bacterium]